MSNEPVSQTEPYPYQRGYEKRARSLADLAANGHQPSIAQIAEALADQDANRGGRFGNQ